MADSNMANARSTALTPSPTPAPTTSKSAEKRPADAPKPKRRRIVSSKRGSSSIWSTLAASQLTENGKFKFHCNVCGHVGATNKNFSTSNIIDHFKARHADLRWRLMGMHDGSAPEEDIRREIAVASERWRLVLSAPGVQAGKRFPPARPNGRGSWAPALAPAPAAEAVATPVKIPDGPAAEVVHRLRFDESIKAAAARVEAADRVLAAAVTDEAFGRAAGALDVAVSRLEQIGGCARRCAAVAAFLGKPPETLSSPGSVAGKGDASLDDARSPATQGAGEEGGLGEVEEIVD